MGRKGELPAKKGENSLSKERKIYCVLRLFRTPTLAPKIIDTQRTVSSGLGTVSHSGVLQARRNPKC